MSSLDSDIYTWELNNEQVYVFKAHKLNIIQRFTY